MPMSATESVQHVVQEARRRGLISTEQLARHLRKATSSLYGLLNPYNERDKLSLDDALDILEFIAARAREADPDDDLAWIYDPLDRIMARFGMRAVPVAPELPAWAKNGDGQHFGAQCVKAQEFTTKFFTAVCAGKPYTDVHAALQRMVQAAEAVFVNVREHDPAGGRARASMEEG
jgi:hypothetical protein